MNVRDFTRKAEIIPVPCLTRMQVEAYDKFLQRDIPHDKKHDAGLQALISEHFPIKNHDGTITLDYISYEIGMPRYTADECRELKLTFGAPLKIRFRLNKNQPVEEDVYMGDIPLMLGGGEFIINGAERVIVNQLHRSPGVDFVETKTGDTKSYSASIVPERGSWIEFNVTKKEALAVRIDQSSKIPATTLMRALFPDMSTSKSILEMFYKVETINITSRTTAESLINLYSGEDIYDKNKQVMQDAGKPILEPAAKKILASGITQLTIIPAVEDHLIANTVAEDTTKSHEEALHKIYAKLRPGTPFQLDRAKSLIQERFFDISRYRLSRVGRFRLNRKLNLDIPETEQLLRKEDVVETVSYILKMRKGTGKPDDIDHLGNRRVRTVDELAGEEIRKGFLRLKRAVSEKLNGETIQEQTPRTLINSKIVSSAAEYFFGRGELSQVVDQTNPLSQLTHERRLSALGPGGLNRKRAGFEVRDVHMSHYGRICPIETPEGANIGLITSTAIYAATDEYGFLLAPYRKVKNGTVTDEVVYLRAGEETDIHFAPADIPTDKKGKFITEKILARVNGEFEETSPEKIQYIDVSPKQIIGVSAALIPFLEHDDANRALMGSNMQRQAVPLLVTEPPLVATGMEVPAAQNSSMVVTAKKDGVVAKVTADEIIVDDVIYKLTKFRGLNEKTSLNQKPIINEGDKVKKGQVIADGAGTCNGELSLGKNVLVAFMPWEGYNFEDAIIVSERLVKEHTYTSVHVEDFECVIRETKLGREEFTRDIPNVQERALKNLDENGIVTVGTYVKPGDILVGKVAPKSKSELSPEERLLYAIFGKAGEDVKNESLSVPSGVEGVVIKTQHFTRKTPYTEKERAYVKKEERKYLTEFEEKIQSLINTAHKNIVNEFGKDVCPTKPSFGPKGKYAELRQLKEHYALANFEVKGKKELDTLSKMLRDFFTQCDIYETEKDRMITRLTRGDELPSTILEMVKVYIATKRNLSVGDKMAGRHGNKGVISKILPEEDMPFMADGTTVDIILNPLGVPSRMNIGQILETHFGWVAKQMNIRIVTPPFGGCREDDLEVLKKEGNLPMSDKVVLYDGRTGEPFKEEVTVGYAYIMKLHHLADDKIHARATGPYSLITQQPLGGKARYGGQRFGEMEVWALEAYGAANILQELLTVKSDDVDGRTKIYESIIKGENVLEPGTPMSFEVLTNEIKGLALNLKLEKKKGG
ncbi:MAG: DNA-directed RNA polymerase subunit beta [Planctomycetes bacterium]|nr:DNA-directed RNA polymerase subunit beta [Planctomycetota bacterium]